MIFQAYGVIAGSFLTETDPKPIERSLISYLA